MPITARDQSHLYIHTHIHGESSCVKETFHIYLSQLALCLNKPPVEPACSPSHSEYEAGSHYRHCPFKTNVLAIGKADACHGRQYTYHFDAVDADNIVKELLNAGLECGRVFFHLVDTLQVSI